MERKKIKFTFNIYKKENYKKVEDFNVNIYRTSLNTAVNYVNEKYKNYCIERV